MSLPDVIVAGVESFTYERLTGGLVIRDRLWLSSYRRHVVGSSTTDGIVVVSEPVRTLQQCGGSFLPSVYRACGPITEMSQGSPGPDQEFDLEIDCGVRLDIGQRVRPPWLPPAPHLNLQELKTGDWVATFGQLWLIGNPMDEQPPSRLTVSGVRVLDIRPSSSTFGQIIPWEFGAGLPHDPDTFPLPSVYVDLLIEPDGSPNGPVVAN